MVNRYDVYRRGLSQQYRTDVEQYTATAETARAQLTGTFAQAGIDLRSPFVAERYRTLDSDIQRGLAALQQSYLSQLDSADTQERDSARSQLGEWTKFALSIGASVATAASGGLGAGLIVGGSIALGGLAALGGAARTTRTSDAISVDAVTQQTRLQHSDLTNKGLQPLLANTNLLTNKGVV